MKKLRIILALILAAILLAGSVVAPVMAADQRIQSTEEMVGANHSTKADTLNRLTLAEHNTDGTHKLSGFQATQYAADAGSSDSYAVTLTPAPPAYFTGMVINFKANTVNTGAATLNVNSLGAKTIKKQYNIDLADGDIKANSIVTVVYDGTNFQLVGPVPSEASVLVQVQHAVVTSMVSGSTVMPQDDTIPQNTEGFEVITCNITPKSASNNLLIMATVGVHNYVTEYFYGMALFRDSAANALAAISGLGAASTGTVSTLVHQVSAGSPSATTFKIRLGPKSAGTLYVNAVPGATGRAYGGVAASTLTIFEYTP